MADRIDIDALLIGALYGELSSADEARLSAHLESHPADRTALEDLKSARHAVRESRIFAVQAEPPQPISALLLQEAARRAPRVRPQTDEKESWFARFVNSFARHPAMAAAAMLVLVLGVAGTLALKGGIKDASVKEAAPAAPAAIAQGSAQLDRPNDTAAVAPTQGQTPEPTPEPTTDEFKADLLEQQAVAGKPGADHGAQRKKLEVEKPTAGATKKTQLAGIEVKAKRPMPKDDESPLASDLDGRAEGADQSGFSMAPGAKGGAGGGGTVAGDRRGVATSESVSGPSTNAPMQPRTQGVTPTPAPPPPPHIATTDDAKTSAPKPAEKADKAMDKEAPSNDASTAEVRKMHAQAKAYARNSQCREAATVVLAIERSNVGYYNASVATDRDLKGCFAYIQTERDRSRAAEGKRAKANYEAPAAAPSTSTK
jgi:hypothetical protein